MFELLFYLAEKNTSWLTNRSRKNALVLSSTLNIFDKIWFYIPCGWPISLALILLSCSFICTWPKYRTDFMHCSNTNATGAQRMVKWVSLMLLPNSIAYPNVYSSRVGYHEILQSASGRIATECTFSFSCVAPFFSFSHLHTSVWCCVVCRSTQT